MERSPVLSAIARSNAYARALVAQYGQDPLFSSRAYFLAGLAQLLALGEATGDFDDGDRAAEAVELASLLTLRELFPHDPTVAAAVRRRRDKMAHHGAEMERMRLMLVARRRDGSSNNARLELPQGEHVWRSLENRPPVRPRWGDVTPFAVEPSALAATPPPPPAGSAEHREHLARVQAATEGITPDELRLVLDWAGSIGSPTPAGDWQRLLEALIAHQIDSPAAVVHALLLAEIAMFNAGIGCWQAKFEHLYPRPSNVDPTMRTYIHVPNFPSYSSGHSCFSWAVVGALEAAYPGAFDGELVRHAEDAARSRVLAGVHYPMDLEGGKAMGLAVGRATARALPDFASMRRCAL